MFNVSYWPIVSPNQLTYLESDVEGTNHNLVCVTMSSNMIAANNQEVASRN